MAVCGTVDDGIKAGYGMGIDDAIRIAKEIADEAKKAMSTSTGIKAAHEEGAIYGINRVIRRLMTVRDGILRGILRAAALRRRNRRRQERGRRGDG